MTAAIFFLITTTLFFILSSRFAGHHRLPPGPKGWPVIGSLRLLGKMPHVSLAELSKKYGPVMYLKLGAYGMVVASTPDTAREFLKTQDLNFSNRPPFAGSTYLVYNRQDMAFSDYGPKWKLLRKLTSLHMLGGKAIEDLASVRRVELGHMLEDMYESSIQGERVVVSQLCLGTIANLISQVILSRRVFDTKGTGSKEFKDMVDELMELFGAFDIGDFLPYIAWMDIKGLIKRMKNVNKKFDVLFEKMFKEHRETKHERMEKPDFLDVLMDQMDNPGEEKLTDANIKALLVNMFTAGTDTTTSSIEWALTEMIKNPRILACAQAEMDQVIGKSRRLEESDIPNLPYLQAICKETFRKHPSAPLNLPRVSKEPCEVNGYYIPKGTRLNVNIWAIGRDPNVWEDPLEFNPDRFLREENVKINPSGNDFELIPFGAGRRMCVGAKMGMIMFENILGTMVHSFDWIVPEGEAINMDEAFGLALSKSVPLAVIVIPRLPPSVYGAV
ncbi:hypothetical protein AQUCO_05300083v1 [Aquilegia coerulea]|uniref:Flavonoid 3',5'-hydroxylase n=1 Tax=Aquilegia coerulea TaxID=218851 RepID=A0A2G5CI97_AQUCA|nr:hypothetical protein AQUCO_05300083v1 [Aquilegia coerulea]